MGEGLAPSKPSRASVRGGPSQARSARPGGWGCLSLPSSPLVISHGHSVFTKHSGSQIVSLKQVPSLSLFYR